MGTERIKVVIADSDNDRLAYLVDRHKAFGVIPVKSNLEALGLDRKHYDIQKVHFTEVPPGSEESDKLASKVYKKITSTDPDALVVNHREVGGSHERFSQLFIDSLAERAATGKLVIAYSDAYWEDPDWELAFMKTGVITAPYNDISRMIRPLKDLRR